MGNEYVAAAAVEYAARARDRGLLASRPIRFDGFSERELAPLRPALESVLPSSRVRVLGSLNNDAQGAVNAERATRYRNEVDASGGRASFVLLVPQGQVVESSLDEPAFLVVPRSKVFTDALVRLRTRLRLTNSDIEAIRESARYRQAESIFAFLYAWEIGDAAAAMNASSEYLGLLADHGLAGPIPDVVSRLRENSRAMEVLLRPAQSPGRVVDELTNAVGLHGDEYGDEIVELLTWLRAGRPGVPPPAFDFGRWPRATIEVAKVRFEPDLRKAPHLGWSDIDGVITADGGKARIEWVPLYVPPGTTYETELIEETSQRVVKRIGNRSASPRRSVNWGALLRGDELRAELRDLNPAGDEEGYLFRIRVKVLQGKRWMSDLETLPFSVELAPPAEDLVSTAPSLYHALYRYHSEQRALGPTPCPGDWQELRPTSVCLVSADGKNKEATLDVSSALVDIERIAIADPDFLGPWRWVSDEEGLAPRGASLHQDRARPRPGPETEAFLDARRHLFERLQERGSVERADFRDAGTRRVALDYVRAFESLIGNVREHARMVDGIADADRLRCAEYLGYDAVLLHVREGAAGAAYPVLLVSPTSPVVIAWLLDFQDLVYAWSRGRFDAALKPSYKGVVESLGAGPRSMVYVTPGADDRVSWWGFGGSVAALWQCYLPIGEHDAVRSKDWERRVLTLLGLPARTVGAGRGDARRIGQRLKRYCVLHPTTNQLKLAAVIPGDGFEVLEALRVIDEKAGTPPGAQSVRDIRYEVTIVGPRSITLGRAIDDFTLNPGEARWRRFSDAILDNPETVLSPSFGFAKRPVPAPVHHPGMFWSRLADEMRTFSDGVNLTILGPMLSTSVGVAPVAMDDDDTRMAGIVARPATRLLPAAVSTQYEGNWVLAITAPARPGASCSSSGLSALAAAINLAHGVVDDRHQVGLQVALAGGMSDAIRAAHEVSDWVVMSDPLFAIEQIDRPASTDHDALLLDYSPEFDPYPGGRVVVTTSSLGELAALSGAVGHALTGDAPMAAILSSISSRLLLGLANPTQQVVHGLVGLALTRMFVAAANPAALVIPIDGHEDMFVTHRKASSGQMADLLVVDLTDGLSFEVIESKWSGRANLQAQLDGALGQAKATAEVIRSEYLAYDGVDRAMRAENLLDVALFHLARGARHGLSIPVRPAQLREAFSPDALRTARVSASVVAWCPDTSTGSDRGIEHDGVREWLHGSDDIRHYAEMMLSWPSAVSPVDAAHGGVESEVAPERDETLAAVKEVEEETATAGGGDGHPASQTQQGVPSTSLRSPAAAASTPDAAATSQTSDRDECVVLGHVVNSERVATWCPTRLSNGHMILVGGSGAGKTTALRHITSQLRALGVPVLVLDFHGDIEPYGSPEELHSFDYEGNKAFVNPFHLDPSLGSRLTPTRLKWEFIEAWRSQYPSMGVQQTNFLTELIESAFARAGINDDPATWRRAVTFGDVIDEFDASDTPDTVKSKIRAYMKRFSEWKIFHGGEGIGVEMFLNRSVRLDLSQLDESARNILADVVLRRLFLLVRALGPVDPEAKGWEKFRLYVVIDEAQLLMGSTGDAKASLTKYAAEARKFGIGLILATQLRDNVPAEIWGNIDTRLFMQALDPGERARNARAANVAEDALRSLSRGEAILISSSQPRQIPLTVRIEPAWLT